MTKYGLKNCGKIVFLMVACMFLFNFKPTQTTRADAAPPPPPSGSDIFPAIETTNVRMISERVLIDVLGYSSYPSEEAYVTAQFIMRNLGDTTEQMEVRFPLNHNEYDLEDELENNAEFCEFTSPFPSIDEITVWVNGSKVDTTKTSITVISPITAGETVTLPCWAYFDVVFPPGEDIAIKVAYSVAGYLRNSKMGFIEFTYVLGTGAGWRDTIGKADIIARLPYDVNELNFDWCSPEDCEISGKEISWHYEDFEPFITFDNYDKQYLNTTFRIVRPSFWQRVLAEQAHLASNPNDGEAWGRLGKIYKEIISTSKGLELAPKPADRLFELSREAYQKAVDFLPNDADWHYGFAELLCAGLYGESETDQWGACVEQLKLALDIDPDHAQANELLQGISYRSEEWGLGIVDLSGTHPDYLVLTPQPSATVTKIQPSATKLPASKTSVPTITATPQATPTATVTATQTPEPENTSTEDITDPVIVETQAVPNGSSEDTGSNSPIYIGAGLLLVVIVITVVIWRRK